MRRKRTKKDEVSHLAQKASRPRVSEEVAFPEPETGSKPLKNMVLDRAALLIAQGELTNQNIALLVGIQRSTLQAWKNKSWFASRVSFLRQQLSAAALEDVISQARRRADGQDPDVRAFYAKALEREVLGAPDEAVTQPVHHIHERHDRPAEATATPVPIAPVIYESPESAARKAFEEYCYGPKREPMCLSSDIMHRHSTR